MARRLQEQVVIVTGGGRGFGSAIAQRFAAEGAKVAVTARTQSQLRDRSDPAEGLAKCAEFCFRLASGKCDALSGQYIDVREDLDEKLRLERISAHG